MIAFKSRKTKKIEKLQLELQEWKDKYNSKFAEPLPTKHPDLKHPIELAFEVDGEMYYRFKNETDLASYPRYQGAALFLELYPLKLTKDEFVNWIISLNEAFDKQDGSLARMLTNEMMNRQQHLTHYESVYQIAAQVFFTLEDDLGDVVEPDEVQRRIKLFQKKSLREFIAIQPIANLVMYQALLDKFSGDASQVEKLFQMEKVIRKAQKISRAIPKTERK